MSGIFEIAGLALAIGNANLTPIQIEGAVHHPGPILVERSQGLRAAIQHTGGFNKDADLRSIHVARKDGTRQTYNLYAYGPSPSLKAGDVVYVPSIDPGKVIFTEGPVLNRGPIDFAPGMTLADALSKMQPAMKGQMDRVTVTRGAGEEAQTQTFKAKDLVALAPTIHLMPGDRVAVPYAAQVRSDRELITILLIAVVVLAIAK